MGRIFDEQGQRRQEYGNIPQPSAAPQQTQPQLSPYQRFVSGGAIPTIGALLGGGGGFLAGGPGGAALGAAGVGGGAKVLQEMLKLKAGLPTTPAEQFVKEEPVKFAGRYVAGGAGGQVLQSLPGLLGTLPIVGPKLQQKYGGQIEKLTRFGAGNYPAQDLQANISEKTRKYAKDPKVQKLIFEEQKRVSQFANPQGLIDVGDIQDFKEKAYSKSWEKLAPAWQRNFWKTVGNVYRDTTLEIQPALEQPLEKYAGIQKGKQLIPSGEELRVGAKRQLASLPAYTAKAILIWRLLMPAIAKMLKGEEKKKQRE